MTRVRPGSPAQNSWLGQGLKKAFNRGASGCKLFENPDRMKRMKLLIIALALVLPYAAPTASGQVLIPNLGDTNCDGQSNVVDVQLAIVTALGIPLNTSLDADQDGIIDGCETYASAVSGNCEVGQVIQWNGTVWACADDAVGATEPGPTGPAGEDGADGKNSLIELGPAPSVCPENGVQLFIGLDADGNGALSLAEALNTIEICDGAVGPAGEPGPPGDDGALAGLDCPDGSIVQNLGGQWACAEPPIVDEAQVESWVQNGPIDLAPGSTIGGHPVGGVAGTGGAGTVLYTHCPWVGSHGKDLGSCEPPACPAGWEDLGVVGNRMAHSTGTGASSGIMDSSFTTTHGTQERGCYHTEAWTLLQTRCSWVGSHGKALSTCDPPPCPTEWNDLGVTGYRVHGAGTTGASSGIMDSSFTAAHGTQERTCTR